MTQMSVSISRPILTAMYSGSIVWRSIAHELLADFFRYLMEDAILDSGLLELNTYDSLPLLAHFATEVYLHILLYIE